MRFVSGSKKFFLGVIFLLGFSLSPSTVKAQVVLYLEIMTETKPIKYYEGQKLMFKSAEFEEDWQTILIEKILVEDNLILYDGGMLALKDIIEIRRSRPWATAVGYMLQTFGVAWFGFGGIAHFTTSTFDFGVDTLVIGTTAIASGWLIKKLFRFKHYKIGKKVRLKILDLSWPEPRG